MKCINCILVNMVDEFVTPEQVQQAVDGARTAVTVTEGSALCSDHLTEKILKFVTRYPDVAHR